MTAETARDSRLISRDGDLTVYRLNFPYSRPPKALTGNYRGHWQGRSKASNMVRQDIVWLAKLAGMPAKARHVTVELVWAPGDNRRRDSDNLWPLLKASADGLARGPRRDWVGLELVPDDTPAFMEKRAPRIEPPPAVGLWLEIEVLA